MNLLFFQVRLFTVRVRLKLRASVALSPVFSNTSRAKKITPFRPFGAASIISKKVSIVFEKTVDFS